MEKWVRYIHPITHTDTHIYSERQSLFSIYPRELGPLPNQPRPVSKHIRTVVGPFSKHKTCPGLSFPFLFKIKRIAVSLKQEKQNQWKFFPGAHESETRCCSVCWLVNTRHAKNGPLSMLYNPKGCLFLLTVVHILRGSLNAKRK